jgi:hypothetical protein
MYHHRGAKIWLAFCFIQLCIILILYFSQSNHQVKENIKHKNQLVRSFLLTDYCLSTESRHTRHIALPELIAPFQDLPAYHEHFPSSSFFPTPKFSDWKMKSDKLK